MDSEEIVGCFYNGQKINDRLVKFWRLLFRDDKYLFRAEVQNVISDVQRTPEEAYQQLQSLVYNVPF